MSEPHRLEPKPEHALQAKAKPEQGGGELERVKRDAAQAKDHYLRLLAEFENTKKRLHREQAEFVRYASETVIRELLPIVDSLDQALVAVDPSARPSTGSGLARPSTSSGLVPSEAEPSRGTRDSAPPMKEEGSGMSAGLCKPVDIRAVMTGIQLIHQQLLKLLEREGVKRIPAVGERFDPHRHEAIAQVDAPDHDADGTIVEEVQVGYTMHSKVIRPAMVKVAKSKEERSSEERSGLGVEGSGQMPRTPNPEP